MKSLRFEEKDKLADILSSIQNTPDEEIEIVSLGNQALDLVLDKKVINAVAEKLGKKVSFREKSQAPTHTPQSQEVPKEHGFVEGRDVAEYQKESREQHPEQLITAKKKGLKEKFKKLLKGPKWAYAGIGIILFLIAAGVSAFWLLPSATVTIFTEPQFQEAEFTLTASENVEEADKEAGIIPLKILETTQEDSIEAQSTGSKTVGEMAKGRVKIVNRDASNSKTFFKGTLIIPISGTKVNFTLDKSATLSAAPAGCEDDCPQVGVDVTSKTIGESGNLKSGTVFKVGDADVNLVFAKNETNFSGGTSKKITVVSSEDQKKAKEDLLKKLEEAAKKDLETENPQTTIPDDGLESDIVKETFGQKVGDEATSFGLSMEVKYSAKAFSKNDLEDILIDQIKDNIPNDFVLDRDGVFVSSEILRRDGSELSILGKIKAALLPAINEEEVKRNIAGKGFGSVGRYLKSLNSVSGFEIKVVPSPFRIFGILPLLRDRIGLEVKQEE